MAIGSPLVFDHGEGKALLFRETVTDDKKGCDTMTSSELALFMFEHADPAPAVISSADAWKIYDKLSKSVLDGGYFSAPEFTDAWNNAVLTRTQDGDPVGLSPDEIRAVLTNKSMERIRTAHADMKAEFNGKPLCLHQIRYLPQDDDQYHYGVYVHQADDTYRSGDYVLADCTTDELAMDNYIQTALADASVHIALSDLTLLP